MLEVAERQDLRPRFRRRWVILAMVVAIGAVAGALTAAAQPSIKIPGAAVGTMTMRLSEDRPEPRTIGAYRGLGAWVDVFDFVPAYTSAPTVTAATIPAMAASGVKTLFLQAARHALDPRAPDTLVDRATLGEILLAAHRAGMKVVGWYLPTFVDVNADLARVQAIQSFAVLGHQFDGVAIDIEATSTVPDVATRNALLVQLSAMIRSAVGSDPVGAIVLPPVQTEVVNPSFWPSFPWHEIEPYYDVWLPMSYWTFRKVDSGYNDGYTYNEESTRRLRANLGDPNAVVHGIGGIGDLVTPESLTRFVQSLVDTGSVGGSIYDWTTLSEPNRTVLNQALAAVTLAPAPK